MDRYVSEIGEIGKCNWRMLASFLDILTYFITAIGSFILVLKPIKHAILYAL